MPEFINPRVSAKQKKREENKAKAKAKREREKLTKHPDKVLAEMAELRAANLKLTGELAEHKESLSTYEAAAKGSERRERNALDRVEELKAEIKKLNEALQLSKAMLDFNQRKAVQDAAMSGLRDKQREFIAAETAHTIQEKAADPAVQA